MFPGNNICLFMIIFLVGMVFFSEEIILIKKNQILVYEKKYEMLCNQIEQMNQQAIQGSDSQ